jgi:hypothetical protein
MLLSLTTRLAKSSGGSSGGSTKALSQQEITSGIRQGLEKVKGRDNHVAPKDLKKAYDLWLGSGLSR